MQPKLPRFPSDILLKASPLVEAWLEVRWQLPPAQPQQLQFDPQYALAVGAFYQSIRGGFPVAETVEKNAPQIDIPYVVRHRFRPMHGSWPVIQIGPGVLSVNYTSPYSWSAFRQTVSMVRPRLVAAYGESRLELASLVLRYRNAVPFEYSSKDLLDYLGNLNMSVTVPEGIPGFAGSKTFPTSANISLTYDLSAPKGTGSLQVITGHSKLHGDVISWQLEVATGGTDTPSIHDHTHFLDWLDSAHAVAHDWFFSIVEGPLMNSFVNMEPST